MSPSNLMEGIPEFSALLGKSTLFDSDQTSSRKDAEQDVPAGQELTKALDDNGYHGIRTFITGKGKVLKLRKKPRANIQRCVENRVFGDDNNRAAWREDETYGININVLLDKIESTGSCRDSNPRDRNNRIKEGNKLWVEKWGPKNFLDLVGNEKANRRVLRWIRQWSACVFNEQLPERLTETPEQEMIDPLQRPPKKILLIHGPPGIGKTSVAHVAAKQAGYSIAEINASDERAGTLVRDKIHNTLFNHTFNDKPVCLIADEIDGSIEGGFIKILVDIIDKDRQASQKHLLGPGSNLRSKKRKKKAKLLVRPIIAICNNLYAPALEKLKPHCEIIAVKKPSDSSVQERLEEICKAEGLKISIKALKELTSIAQGDIRNCVNNLQFLGAREEFREGRLDEESLDSISKDFSESWFKICNQMFRRDPRQELQHQLRDKTQLMDLNGNPERVVQGCHSLYPHVKYSDNGLQKPANIADWLFYHDLMFKSLFEHNGELLRYSSVVPLAFFNLFGDVANRDDHRIQNSDYEVRERQKSNLEILKLMMHKISVETPSTVPFTSLESLALEVLPHLDFMLSSDLNKCRDPKTKQTMYDNLIGMLKCFQLSLAEKSHESFSAKKILFVEPPIDNIVVLDTQRQKEVNAKRPMVLDILLAKVEESNARKRHAKKVNEDKARNEEIKSNNIKTRKSGVSMADFFKSQYKVDEKNQNNVSATTKNGSGNDSGFRIWVKYKEGFSDAVRKNVSWHDLWS